MRSKENQFLKNSPNKKCVEKNKNTHPKRLAEERFGRGGATNQHELQHNTTKITIMPGGGITESNAHAFAHFNAVHFSGTTVHTENSQTMPMSFLSAAMLDENTTWVSDVKRLKAIQYKLRKR